MTGKLITEPRLADPDGLYATLIAAYRDLDEAASQRFNSKLILLLANHIGDAEVVGEAVAIARGAAR